MGKGGGWCLSEQKRQTGRSTHSERRAGGRILIRSIMQEEKQTEGTVSSFSVCLYSVFVRMSDGLPV